MKLTQYSAKTFPKTSDYKDSAAKIKFTKAGYIAFNHPLCALAGLKIGDTVCVAQDEDQPENWYIYKHPDGYALKPHSNKKQRDLVFAYRALIKEVFSCFEFPLDKGQYFEIDATPVTLKGDKTIYWKINF